MSPGPKEDGRCEVHFCDTSSGRCSEEASVIEIRRGVFAPSVRGVSPFSRPHGGVCLQSHSTHSLIYLPLAVSLSLTFCSSAAM